MNILLLNKEEQLQNKDEFIKELADHTKIFNEVLRGIDSANNELRESAFHRVHNALYTLELERALHLRMHPHVDPEYWKQKARMQFEENGNLHWVFIEEEFENLA